jgi:phthiocerol/phenolphthiocerol synthesis type-I polyketide synthase D
VSADGQQSALAKASQLIDLSRRKIAQLTAKLHGRVAITGRAFRFPGGLETPDAFWEMLARGGEVSEEVPADRWNAAEICEPGPVRPGKSATSRGGFIRRVREFDAAFFGISAREARDLDPQQRLLLEVTWEALEDAQLTAAELRGSSTGVFIGICSSDYATLASRQPPEQLSGYAGTGIARSPAAGRISYALGLKGPSIAIDTACSASLVALHLAVQSVRRGECERAIVGGVTLILEPSTHIAFSQAGMLAPDGRCKTFSDRADGYGRAEGVGVIIIEQQRVVERSGSKPLAWVHGSAVNQDGPAGGLTVPNGPAQQEVVRAALQDANLSPNAISFIETHGTGTPLGDLIEVNALSAVFGRERAGQSPVALGAIKAHCGHMEAAAGIGGVIKVVEQLQRRQIPPLPDYGPLNQRIAWQQIPLRVPRASEAWGEGSDVLYAGVSSFGFSGTNAHVILGSAEQTGPANAEPWVPRVLPLSARTPEALLALRTQYEAFLAESSRPAAAVLAAAQLGRESFAERVAVVGQERDQLRTALATGEGLRTRRSRGPKAPKLAWLFTGQGSQRHGMGRALYDTQPVFRAALDRCAALLAQSDVDLLELLFGAGDRTRLDRTRYTQPALLAYEWALAELWKHWGIAPDALLGHSVGELAAACVAGVFSLEDGLRLIAARGALMDALPAGGKMLAVQASPETVADFVSANAADVSVAAINGPTQVVLSGAAAPLERLAQELEQKRTRFQWLVVSHAFHSPLMRPMLEAFERVAAEVRYRRPSLPVISNVSGAAAGPEIATAAYWRDHVLACVQFTQGMRALEALGCRAFLEIGPQPTLTQLGRRVLATEDALWLASARGSDGLHALEDSLATLFVEGFDVRWRAIQGRSHGPRVPLPKYPFERTVYWLGASQLVKAEAAIHPLLGPKLDSAALQHTAVHDALLDTSRSPYLDEHRVFGGAVFPATGYVELVLAAARANRAEPQELRGLEIERPLPLGAQQRARVQVLIGSAEDPSACQVLLSNDRGEWLRLCRAHVQPAEAAEALPMPRLDGDPVDVPALRAQNHQKGLDHGDAFWALREAVLVRGERPTAVGRLSLVSELRDEARAHVIHPVLLDGCFQVAMCLSLDESALFLPVGLDSLRVFEPGASGGICRVELRDRVGTAIQRLDLTLHGEDGRLIAQASGVTARRTTRDAMLRTLRTAASITYSRAFEPAPIAAPSSAGSVFALVGPASELSAACLKQLTARGAQVVEQSENATLLYVVPELAQDADPLETVAEQVWAITRLLQQRQAKALRLRVLANGAQSRITRAIAALLNSAAQENPALDAALVGLTPYRSDALSAAVLDEIAGGDAAEVYFAESVRMEPRWRALPLPPAEGKPLVSSEHTYLISGGTGALGLACAKRLVERGARSIVLAQRSEPSETARAVIDELRERSAQITLARADLSRRADVEQLFQSVLPSLPPLGGILHAAGTLADALLPDLEQARVREVFAAKAGSAQYLDEYSRGHQLQFFVTFSSIAAAFGSPGQSHYAAANAACDALIEQRRRAGLPGTSIQWGPWAEIGMAAQLRDEQVARMQAAGLHRLAPDRALDALEAVLVAEDLPATLLAADLDWDLLGVRWLRANQRRQLENLARRRAPASDDGAALRALAQATPAERAAGLMDYIAGHLSEALGQPASRLRSADVTLTELGVDSLAAVELTNRLARALRIELPRRLEIDQLTLPSLVQQLLEQPIPWSALAGATAAPQRQASPQPPAAEAKPAATDCEEQSWRGHNISLGGLRWGKRGTAPVMLVHGIRAHAGAWAPMAQALRAAGLTHCVAPDLRGHGKSGHGPSGHCLDWVDVLRDARSVFQTEATEPLIVLAHSFGASVACLYAALYPEQIRELVLIEPVITMLQQPRPEPNALRGMFEAHELAARRQQHPALPDFETAVDLVRREYPANGLGFCQELARRVVGASDGALTWTWDPRLRDYERFATPLLDAESLEMWVRKLAMPVHCFVAEQSPYPTRLVAQRLSELAPDVTLHSLAGTHQLHCEAPGPIAQLVARLSRRASSTTNSQTAVRQDDLRT